MAEKQVAPDARTFCHLFRVLRFVRDPELLEPWLLATLREMALLRICIQSDPIRSLHMPQFLDYNTVLSSEYSIPVRVYCKRALLVCCT